MPIGTRERSEKYILRFGINAKNVDPSKMFREIDLET